NVNSNPVRGVKHFGKIFRIAVFPPADTRFIWVINASYVRALKRGARICFLKICALAHSTVSDAEQTFGRFYALRIKSFFNDRPRMGLYVILIHEVCLRIKVSKKLLSIWLKSGKT